MTDRHKWIRVEAGWYICSHCKWSITQETRNSNSMGTGAGWVVRLDEKNDCEIPVHRGPFCSLERAKIEAER